MQKKTAHPSNSYLQWSKRRHKSVNLYVRRGEGNQVKSLRDLDVSGELLRRPELSTYEKLLPLVLEISGWT